MYQTKLLFFEESVIIKITDPSRFPAKAPLPGVFTENIPSIFITYKERWFRDRMDFGEGGLCWAMTMLKRKTRKQAVKCG